MTGKFIAVANMKGGVGKTTTVISLAEALAADDMSKSILVVDIDPQASASLCLAGDEVLAEMIDKKQTLQDLLRIRLIDRKKDPPVDNFIRDYFSFTIHKGSQLNISLLPCGPLLRLLERQIIYKLTKAKFSMNLIEERLWTLFQADFAPLVDKYDYVIFDCPPSISPFSEVAIRSSNLVIVPTIPDRISNFGLNAFCLAVWKSDLSSLPPPPRPEVLITRVQQNVVQQRHMVLRLEAEASASDAAFGLFSTRIPQSAQLASALSRDEVQTFSKKYGQSLVPTLSDFITEIKEMLNVNRT